MRSVKSARARSRKTRVLERRCYCRRSPADKRTRATVVNRTEKDLLPRRRLFAYTCLRCMNINGTGRVCFSLSLSRARENSTRIDRRSDTRARRRTKITWSNGNKNRIASELSSHRYLPESNDTLHVSCVAFRNICDF